MQLKFRFWHILALTALWGVSACGGRVPQDRPVTASTQAVIVSPTENRLYVFDLLVNRVALTLPTGQVPRDVALGSGGQIFVANNMDSSLSVFQRVTADQFARVGTVGTPLRPEHLVYNPVYDELYVTSETQSRIQVYRASNPNRQPIPIHAITFNSGALISALAVSPDGNTLYATNQNTPELLFITRNQDSFTVAKTLALPEGSRIVDLALSGSNLFLCDQFQDKIHILDLPGQKLEKSVALKDGVTGDNAILPERMAVNRAGTKLYVTGNGASVVSVLDIANQKLLRNIALNSESSRFKTFAPLGLDLSNNDERLYVTTQSGRNIAILQTSPDPASAESVLSTLGTTASEGNLRPLGQIRVIRSIERP